MFFPGASGGRSPAAKRVTAKCCRRNLLADAVFPVSCDIQQAEPVNNPESCHHGHRSVFVLGWGGCGVGVGGVTFLSCLFLCTHESP